MAKGRKRVVHTKKRVVRTKVLYLVTFPMPSPAMATRLRCAAFHGSC